MISYLPQTIFVSALHTIMVSYYYGIVIRNSQKSAKVNITHSYICRYLHMFWKDICACRGARREDPRNR
jgi:hypothetical protein